MSFLYFFYLDVTSCAVFKLFPGLEPLACLTHLTRSGTSSCYSKRSSVIVWRYDPKIAIN